MIRARRGVRQESMYLVAAGGEEFALRRVVEPGADARDKPELAVLPSSVPEWNPAAILSAGGFAEVLRTLQADYDVVILDSSPLAAVSDAAPLLSMVDGVLVVTRLKKSPVPAVREMLSVFERVPHSNVLGVVANDLRDRGTVYMYSRPYGEKS
jgi:Mrp family chromosome partitioning ATPase